MNPALAVAVLAAASLVSRAGLEAGPHGVGFRVIDARDLSRPSLSATGAAAASAGREIPIGVWYPAAAAATAAAPGRARPLRFSDAVERLVFDLDPSAQAFSPAQRRAAARRLFEATLAEHGADRAKLAESFPAIYSLTLAARPSAPPARGKFPLVLFPGYRPFAV